MKIIELDTFFNNYQVHIEVTRAFSGTYQVWINKCYHGILMKAADGWIVHLHRNTFLQGDDVTVIIGMIEHLAVLGD
jgi:hypothetical protein